MVQTGQQSEPWWEQARRDVLDACDQCSGELPEHIFLLDFTSKTGEEREGWLCSEDCWLSFIINVAFDGGLLGPTSVVER